MTGIEDSGLAAALAASAQLLAADDLFDFDLDSVKPADEAARASAADEWLLQEVPMSCIAPLDEEVDDDPSSFADLSTVDGHDDIWVEIAIH